jgi:RES domain
MLYRMFPWSPAAGPTDPGGPLHAPRFDQGEGRHDNPEVYGALYLSRTPTSPVAEFLREYVGRPLDLGKLLEGGSRAALAVVDESDLAEVLDLDEPANLVARELRPSGVATRARKRTQRQALDLYREGLAGFEWWSTIEASWINVTLFADRSADRLRLVEDPVPLTPDHPVIEEAAAAIGLVLA